MSNQSQPRVAVIILTWNRVDELEPCLTSFAKNEYRTTDVIVVDNGSEDESVSTVQRDFSWVKLIANGENLGFCRGNNVGLRYALEQRYDYVMLLNSDTELIPGLITELVRVLESDPTIGIVGAKNVLLENPEYMWGQYGVVTWGPMLVKTIGRFKLDEHLNEAPKDVPWVIGNACMMRRDALEKVGLFDEEFWQCNEDVDWCYRCRKAGFRVVYVDSAGILHKGGSSADMSHKKVFSYGYFIGRNAWTFARKHGNIFQKALLLTTMLAGMAGRILFFSLDATKNAILGQHAFVAGMLDGMRGRLRPELITVTIPDRSSRRFRQGIRGRLMRWLGV